MPRALILLVTTLLLTALLVAAAPAQAPVPEQRIRAGVTVSGVDVGNLTLAEAQLRLEQTLGPILAGDVVVTAAGKRFALRMKAIGFAFRADNTALRALYAGQAAPPAADGTLPPASATPSVAYRRKPVWRFVRAVAKRVGKAPRNATIRITLRKLIKRSGRPGRAIAVRPLVAAIQATLANPLAPRQLAPAVRSVRPKVQRKDLARAYPVVLTIDRAHFTLRLFKRLRQVRHYGVAVGQPAYPTPTGLFSIASKQVNPTWTAPNSPWAGELAGQSISGSDPTNPLKARWLGIADGVGIHGTGEPWTIGTRASHGCIRMRVPDVIRLYRHVPVGTPVLIR
jgi:lipoprotein-anchoring transpeptidase ErfK/SrfK